MVLSSVSACYERNSWSCVNSIAVLEARKERKQKNMENGKSQRGQKLE